MFFFNEKGIYNMIQHHMLKHLFFLQISVYSSTQHHMDTKKNQRFLVAISGFLVAFNRRMHSTQKIKHGQLDNPL